MNGDRTVVRDKTGKAVAVDINRGGSQIHRYSVYEGTSTAKELIEIQKDGKSTPCKGTDFLGNPVYKK